MNSISIICHTSVNISSNLQFRLISAFLWWSFSKCSAAHDHTIRNDTRYWTRLVADLPCLPCLSNDFENKTILNVIAVIIILMAFVIVIVIAIVIIIVILTVNHKRQ